MNYAPIWSDVVLLHRIEFNVAFSGNTPQNWASGDNLTWVYVWLLHQCQTAYKLCILLQNKSFNKTIHLQHNLQLVVVVVVFTRNSMLSVFFLMCLVHLLVICSDILARLRLPLAFPDLVMSVSQCESKEVRLLKINQPEPKIGHWLSPLASQRSYLKVKVCSLELHMSG